MEELSNLLLSMLSIILLKIGPIKMKDFILLTSIFLFFIYIFTAISLNMLENLLNFFIKDDHIKFLLSSVFILFLIYHISKFFAQRIIINWYFGG